MTADLIDLARPEIEATLERLLGEDSGEDPGRLREAMRYAVLGGGKRLRPLVTLAACAAAGGDWRAALPAAAAIELLHAYTLVHDDLPAMDDDEVRRGRPTVHVAFGEAQAILVGDALLTAAFGALAPLGDRAVAALEVLSARAGVRGLLAGQARDIADTRPETIEELERIHAGKTGALFAAAAELGAIAAGADADVGARLARFGMAMGISFQYADDLADGDHVHLAAEAARRARALHREIDELLRPFGERALPLKSLAERFA